MDRINGDEMKLSVRGENEEKKTIAKVDDKVKFPPAIFIK